MCWWCVRASSFSFYVCCSTQWALSSVSSQKLVCSFRKYCLLTLHQECPHNLSVSPMESTVKVTGISNFLLSSSLCSINSCLGPFHYYCMYTLQLWFRPFQVATWHRINSDPVIYGQGSQRPGVQACSTICKSSNVSQIADSF